MNYIPNAGLLQVDKQLPQKSFDRLIYPISESTFSLTIGLVSFCRGCRRTLVHPLRTLRKQLFPIDFFMLFQIKHAARSIFLAIMVNMSVFQMAATQKYRKVKIGIAITQILILIDQQNWPLKCMFLMVTNMTKLITYQNKLLLIPVCAITINWDGIRDMSQIYRADKRNHETKGTISN